MLKRLTFLAPMLPLAAAVPLVVSAPDARSGTQELDRDGVLERYYEAVGGPDTWESIRSMKTVGSITLGQGLQAPFTVLKKRPNRVRVEFEVQGMTGLQAYDGETAWMFMPFTGQTEPQELSGVQAVDLRDQADFDGPLVGWREEGHEVELAGRDTVEGTATYRLDVRRASGRTEQYFLDAERFVPVRIVTVRDVEGGEAETGTYLGDYRKVGEIMMAHSIRNEVTSQTGSQSQSVTIDSVELNPSIADSLFTMPSSGGGSGGDGS